MSTSIWHVRDEIILTVEQSRVQARLEELLPGHETGLDKEESHMNRAEAYTFVMDRFFDNDIEQLPAYTADDNLDDEICEQHEEYDSESESDDQEDQTLHQLREAITKSSAYDWLISSLHTEARLCYPTPNVMEELRQRLLASLPSSHMSRRTASQEFQAKFLLDWDPISFIQEQQYTETIDEIVEGAITLTGEAKNSQATTISQYMAQTWPFTGCHILELVKSTLRTSNDRHTMILPDGTEVSAALNGNTFEISVAGVADALAEVMQQFAWLGAAMRSSSSENNVAMCTPYIETIRRREVSAEALEITPMLTSVIECSVKFRLHDSVPKDKAIPGQCWSNMFRNPVLVQGFPILARRESSLGLEMPLEMMAALIDTKHATTFEDQIFIKGFSAMLVATKITHDLLIWHYVFRDRGQDGQCQNVSYLDHGVTTEDIGMWQLRESRHIVGWCNEGSHYTGTY